MACRSFEGQLKRKKWIGWQTCFVRLRRGTVFIYDKRADLEESSNDMTSVKKSLHYHLDLASITTGKNVTTIKLRLHGGEILKFRVSKTSGTPYREEWSRIFREHIAYANRCAGVSSSIMGVAEPASLLALLAKESKERMDLLQLSLLSFHVAFREMQAARPDGLITERVHDVAGAAERAQKALREFYDAILQENLFREEELLKERGRSQLAEDTLEVVTSKYNALLVTLERAQTGRSVASSEYFTPPSHCGRSIASSVYYTPEGSLRGFMDAYHSDDELSLITTDRDRPESLAFEKDDLLLPNTKLHDDVDFDRILRALYAAAKRRQTPRLASFGPMSVAGSSYNDLTSIRSERFEDCISLTDTRSFVVSNGHAITATPESDVDTTNSSHYTDARSHTGTTKSSKSSHYSDARSNLTSDNQSFKSAASDV